MNIWVSDYKQKSWMIPGEGGSTIYRFPGFSTLATCKSESAMKLFGISVCCLLLAIPAGLTGAQARGDERAAESAQAFVQGFYDWYVPGVLRSIKNNKEFDWQKRASAFDPTLVSALNEDADAIAKAQDNVGLDFDPFLASQDPCRRYEAGKVTSKGSRYFVEIHGICRGKREAKPSVVAELTERDGSWIFVNFHYPDAPGGDLLNILKILRENRRN